MKGDTKKLLKKAKRMHKQAIEKYPFFHFAVFLVFTTIFASMVIYFSIFKGEPIAVLISTLFSALSARDALKSYEAWRMKA